MKPVFFYFFLLMLTACAGNESQKEVTEDKVNIESPVDDKTQAAANTATSPPSDAQNTDQPVDDKDGPGLNLWVDGREANKGATVCLQISASGMEQVISMQYSMRWNPKELSFKEIKNFELSTLDKNDFGLNRVKEGIMTAVWIEDQLKGIDLTKKTPIYQLCFDVIGEVGAKSSVRFWSTPTAFESVVLPEKTVSITTHKGEVVITAKK